MHATHGRYLDVDLTSHTLRDYPIPEDWQARFIGGKGLAARILLEELPRTVSALGPENILIFATGPFQGTGLVGAGRHAVLSVSPKSGRVADSYTGGYFGNELGHSGYDGILLRGQAQGPVVLTLLDGIAALEPADDLWGCGTGETEETLVARYPKSRVCSIGIAGERKVAQACIINDRSRSAGRPGFGAVMGSKNLKAVVVRGSVHKTLAHPDRFSTERGDYAKTFLNEGYERFGKYGTGGGVTVLSEMGILPTKNFQEGEFSEAEAIGGIRLHDTILTDRETCAGCPIRCKRAVTTTFDGVDVTPDYGGPEYETLAALGSLCMNSELDAIGVVIAFLMEASEKGLIQERIEWGDPQAIIRLIGSLASREGVAAGAADGLQALAESLKADFSMTIKGVELPMHEPRGKQGMGLSYATTPRGASHMEGLHDTMLASEAPCPELGVDRSYDRFSLIDKASPVIAFENLRSFDNSLVLCCFTSRTTGGNYSYPAIRSLLEAATGLSIGVREMTHIGERAYAAMRILSSRAGHVSDEDGLPARFARPLPAGASAEHPVDPDELKTAIADYYTERGYDRFGPTDATLARLGMEDCVGMIERS